MERTMMMRIGDTYKLWTDYMKSIALDAGVPDSYRMVLTYLLYNPEASQKEIAQYRNIRTSSVSQTVKEMQQDGYLEKETDSADGRYVRLKLTEKGRIRAEKIQERVDLADRRILTRLSARREKEIMAAMEDLSAAIQDELRGRGEPGKAANGHAD